MFGDGVGHLCGTNFEVECVGMDESQMKIEIDAPGDGAINAENDKAFDKVGCGHCGEG